MAFTTATRRRIPNAKRYPQITYLEALQKQLKVMDSTAFSLCMDNKMPIMVFRFLPSAQSQARRAGRKSRHARDGLNSWKDVPFCFSFHPWDSLRSTVHSFVSSNRFFAQEDDFLCSRQKKRAVNSGMPLERGLQADIVLGLPRGGVVVAAEVAHILELPVDVLVVRKIGHPHYREFAVGALAEPHVVLLDERS